MPATQVLMVLVLLLTLPGAAWSGEGDDPDIPALTVAATGAVTASPDQALVTLGMETAGKSLAEAQRQNSSVMQKVMDRLRELKIEKERIQTASFTVSPQYKPPSKRPADGPPVTPAPPEIIGYIVSNTVTVEIRDLEKVPAVIDETMGAGANHFHGLHWTLRNEQPARLDALKVAAAKAREKAAVLSEAVNAKLGRLMQVSEGVHMVRPPAPLGRAMVATNGGGADVPISPGEIKVEATVTLTYELAEQ